MDPSCSNPKSIVVVVAVDDVLQDGSSPLPPDSCGSQVVGRLPEQETGHASAAVSHTHWA